uniref:Magnesium transporter protein 1 n=1 Tax=Rhabditophanes sp. KR3021 TaxID=114890 RepID=A0AC35U474_9BILA
MNLITQFLVISTIIATVYSAAPLTLDDKIVNLQQILYKKPVINFTPNLFKQYVTSQPRNYSVLIMFTALDPSLKCQVCGQANDEFAILANSYRYLSVTEKKLFLGIVDYSSAPEIFQQMNLNSAPAFYHFPAKGARTKEDVMDINSQGFQAEKLARYIKQRTNIDVNILRPPNYGTPAMLAFFLLFACSVIYVRRDNLGFIYNKNVWGCICLTLVFAFMSGQMWNHIQGPPFIMNTRDGPGFISSSSRYQVIAETYIVAILYAAVAVGFIILNEAAAPRKTATNIPVNKNILALTGLFIVIVFFSLLLSVFKMKNRGYPYSFLFQ